MSSPTGGAGAPAARWPGYAAAVWGLVFAAPSFYWAIGGLTEGLTMRPEISAKEP